MEQGVHHLIAYCLNNACRHQAVIDVSSYPPETPVPWFRSKVKCAKCGARGNRIDMRPNWKERPAMPTKLDFIADPFPVPKTLPVN